MKNSYLIAVLLGIFLIRSEVEYFHMLTGHLYFFLWELPTVSCVTLSLDDFKFWDPPLISFSTKDIKSTFGILVVTMSPCFIIFSFFAVTY